MKKSLNWLLYETHRWLGVVLALFMFVWFATGLVIMYSTPTAQSRAQQLAHAEVLQPESGWLSVGEVWQRSGAQRQAAAEQRKAKASGGEAAPGKLGGEPALADARLLRSAGEPVWLIEDTHGLRYVLSAVDGGLRETDRTQALRIAQNWFVAEGRNPAELIYLESVEAPAILRNRETLRPFHRIASNEGEELLISARTGEVLHASSRWQRGLFWAGNWIHLFKPLDLLGLGDIRHDVQLWSGAGATIACITGLIIGWLRWRPGFGGKPTYSQGRTQPYREFWFKWHFWTGLIGGTVALSWALSGFVDTNPGKIFSNGEISKAELKRYLGAEVPATMLDWRPAPLRLAGTGIEVVELNWRRLGGETVLLAQGRDGLRLPLTPTGAGPRFSENAIGDAVQRLAGETKVAAVTVLDDYDSYYYPRHHQGSVEKPLPVVLAELDDAAGSRVYLDPQDGQLLAKLDRSRRVFRWLYSGLHHWDFGWLYYRPLWDVWMLTWVGFGLVLGASSLVIGWKRLVKTFAPKKRRVNTAAPSSESAAASPTRSGTLVTEAAD
ncbi:PepSY domain-containing protein [Methylomonas sp. MED-D]|uniref:PepSY domain-containing protein n=1 Tax=Methylomonas sp. MED-D TaxID=3418768 RepID=UPI003D071907